MESPGKANVGVLPIPQGLKNRHVEVAAPVMDYFYRKSLDLGLQDWQRFESELMFKTDIGLTLVERFG